MNSQYKRQSVSYVKNVWGQARKSYVMSAQWASSLFLKSLTDGAETTACNKMFYYNQCHHNEWSSFHGKDQHPQFFGGLR